jgi:hypothetical protein
MEMQLTYFLLAGYANLALYMAIEELIYRNLAGEKYRQMIGGMILTILVAVGVIGNLWDAVRITTKQHSPAPMITLISICVLLICMLLFLLFAIDRWRKLKQDSSVV